MKRSEMFSAILLFSLAHPAWAGDAVDLNRQAVRTVIETYVSAWSANDEQAVLETLTENAVLIPAGRDPVKGMTAIREYWFPRDGSESRVISYDEEILEIGGSGAVAWVLARGRISFEWSSGSERGVVNDRVSFSLTVLEQDSAGRWKIARRMWAPVKT